MVTWAWKKQKRADLHAEHGIDVIKTEQVIKRRLEEITDLLNESRASKKVLIEAALKRPSEAKVLSSLDE